MGNQLNKGFTLIELMVTISIVAIMATIAIPAFQNFIRQSRVTTQATDFVTVLNYARSEAIKRGRAVTMCKSADLAACTAAGNWDQGWIAFVDSNQDTLVSAAAGNTPADVVIRVHAALSGSSTLVGGATISSWIQYLPSGMAIGNGGATANGAAASQTVLCPLAPANQIGRTIEIGFSGRVKSTSNINCP